jgi:NAD(P)-dependent dehydrogenase (short-subunit alcohol dehydrogenase family)
MTIPTSPDRAASRRLRVVVTGAGGALGRVVVDTFERAGHAVVSIDRRGDGAVEARGQRVAAGDLVDPDQASAAIGAAADLLGGIDALIHLAGAFAWTPVAESSGALWLHLYAANVQTAFNVIHAALPHLAAGSSVLCVGAASAQPAGAGMAPYAAAKSGVARLVEALSVELRPRAVRVNAVLPGIIDTPANRAAMPHADTSEWTAPAAIADTIAFLASDQARAITGALLPVTAPAGE